MRRVVVPLMALALATSVFASVAGADSTTTTTQSTTGSSTTPAPKVQWRAPLTGLPDPRGLTRHRSPLTIKIDNTPQAHPQTGIEHADVVYEEIVEGGITRLAAVFDSYLPMAVGPVRSVRRTDREIVSPIGGIFAFSGGAPYALESIAKAPVKLFDESTAGAGMYRDPTRYAPHNLYAKPVTLMKMGGRVHVPRPLFSYARPSSAPVGVRVGEFVVNFAAGYAVTYQWNGVTRSWQRSIFGQPDFSAAKVRLSPTNVVVMTVNYLGGVGRLGSKAQLVGSGRVEVFSDGRLQRGTWHRSSILATTSYRTPSGKPILLRPGQTWVELLASGETISTYAPK
ncbi:MAG: DUF3048 domain-containing protein [Acidimicrobiaceae bacterium]|nr:DUF3048 domain-containing protein [Acidimicrobiaceae bacterium]